MATVPNVAATLPRVPQAQPEPQKKPVAAALSAFTPDSILRSVLAKHPGLASVYGGGDVAVTIADPERTRLAGKYDPGSKLEFWPSTETGTAQFPRPANTNGKTVLEIYAPQLAKNPAQLRTAIYGDLLHGMSKNPYWKSLRTQFMQSFTPQELKRQREGKTWWDDVNGSKDRFGPTYDAYIRGWLANQGDPHQGQAQSGDTMYSPRQLQILQQMENFLATGRVPNGR